MRVESGMSWEQPDGTWRRFAVTLDEIDLQRMGKGDLSLTEAFRALQRAADTLVISQMAKEGRISAESARTQIAQL